MKFELPPPLPEKRASLVRPIPEETAAVFPQTSTQAANGAAPAGDQKARTPPPVPPPSEAPARAEGPQSIAENFAPAGVKRISGAQVVMVAGLLVVPFILVVNWIGGSQKSPTRSADVPLPDNRVYSAPSAAPLAPLLLGSFMLLRPQCQLCRRCGHSRPYLVLQLRLQQHP